MGKKRLVIDLYTKAITPNPNGPSFEVLEWSLLITPLQCCPVRPVSMLEVSWWEMWTWRVLSVRYELNCVPPTDSCPSPNPRTSECDYLS